MILWNGWTPVLALSLLSLLIVSPCVAAGGELRVLAITFDTIKFEMKKGAPFERSMLGERIERLAGKVVKVRGYILPGFQQKGITQFVLVRDNMACCFGPGAALYDCILVEMDAGKSVSYTLKPVAVTGVFSIRELKDPDGKHLAIYHLAGQSME